MLKELPIVEVWIIKSKFSYEFIDIFWLEDKGTTEVKSSG